MDNIDTLIELQTEINKTSNPVYKQYLQNKYDIAIDRYIFNFNIHNQNTATKRRKEEYSILTTAQMQHKNRKELPHDFNIDL